MTYFRWSRAVSLCACALCACALGCQQPQQPSPPSPTATATVAATSADASTPAAPTAPAPTSPAANKVIPSPPEDPAPTGPAAAPSTCVADCIQRSQMKAVSIQQIEADCHQACAAPAGHGDHAGHAAHGDRHRPFPSTADYIARLDRADRAAWQKPDAVIAALALAPDAVVTDLGAGSGYFSFRIAAALPAGRVFALDIDPEMVRHIQDKAAAESIPNVQAVLADPSSPTLPPDTTLALVVDVLHHVPSPSAWLTHVAAQLKPGARLALIEFRMGDIPIGPPEEMRLPKPLLLDMAAAAGLTLSQDLDAVLPHQHLLIFQKP